MSTGLTYRNPVYSANFPDPFVLRFNGRYYAYGTGPAGDGRFFPMLVSADLVHWTEAGGALEPLDLPGAEEYWAPEVAYADGRFWMYYAVGREHDPDHHLRVAVADTPLGPWKDRGLNLTPHEIFAIDAHPFRDPADGEWYLFYARDRLEPPFAGTGLAVDRLPEPDRLEGRPRDVLRPFAEWQVFEKQRPVKRGLDWFTIEGAFVVPVGPRYCCFYSGGRWENPNYGVGYALADHPLGPWREDTGQEGPPLLTTCPGRVVGPGHNSVVTGPDLLSQYVVYHGWDPGCTGRMPRIDRLEWEDGRPRCAGPTDEPQPLPPSPDFLAYFDEAEASERFLPHDAWEQGAAGIRCVAGSAPLLLPGAREDFLAEFSFRASAPDVPRGVLVGDTPVVVEGRRLVAGVHSVSLPRRFRHEAWHTLLVGRRGDWLTVTLDEFPTVQSPCAGGPLSLSLCGAPGVEVAHAALTELGAPK